jgi:hypothetical protein
MDFMLMSNIRFNYLYRDGSNYKKWADVIFSNDGQLALDLISNKLKDCFLEDGQFIAHQIRIPEIFLAMDDALSFDDHCYHEFDSVEITADVPSDVHNRSIQDFLSEVARESGRGWRAFDPSQTLFNR